MYSEINDFLTHWDAESKGTLRYFDQLTDASLSEFTGGPHRTLGRLAWHITVTIPEMLARTGLAVSGPDPEAPVPSKAAEIRSAYERATMSLTEQIQKNWTDATLKVEDEMYGEMWTRGHTLRALVVHQTHHRGQMSVLMRQAGLKVPGIYGPSFEEWAQYGMPAPAV
jgi:uncharacterized damage-inducible protein DinB